MIGIRPVPDSSSIRRIAAVAASPSISGISRSMRMTSKLSPLERLNSFSPVGDRLGSVSLQLENAQCNFLIDGAVVGNEDRSVLPGSMSSRKSSS